MKLARLAAIGDVHGHASLLARAIEACQRAAPDAIVCLGDVAGAPDQTSACCVLLKSNDIVTIRGNHDRWLLEAIDDRSDLRTLIDQSSQKFLSALPAVAHFDTVGGVAIAGHGVAANDLGHFPVTFLPTFLKRLRRLRQLSCDCKIILHSHSHEQRARTLDGVLIVEVGPLHASGRVGCVAIDFEHFSVSAIAY